MSAMKSDENVNKWSIYGLPGLQPLDVKGEPTKLAVKWKWSVQSLEIYITKVISIYLVTLSLGGWANLVLYFMKDFAKMAKNYLKILSW